MRLNFNLFSRLACAATVAALTASAQQTPTIIPVPSAGNNGAGPNGISVTASELLFTQPFCPGSQVRGTYKVTIATPIANSTSTLLDPIPENFACPGSENYLTISTGLGGFATGDRYVTGASTTNPANEAVYKNGLLLFIDGIPASNHHAGITFDTAGTFGFDLIVTAEGSVAGYNPAATSQFQYPAPMGYVLEGATVAPLTYGPCPGCLFITGELASNVNNSFPSGSGAIFFVTPGTPSGSMITKLTDTPGPEPEGLVFVGNNLSCTLGGYSYFVSGYGTGTDIDNPHSTSGAILAYTPAQLSTVAGQFLVPEEGSLGGGPGKISAFSAASGTFSPFSTTAYQLEGSTILQCPAGPVCVIPPSGTAIGGSPVSWNKFNTQGPNNVVWIDAHIGTPSGVSTTTVTTVNFTGVTFVLNGTTYPLPDGLLVFNPSAPATPSTTFDATFGLHGRWVTTVNPNDLSDEIFFDGNALPVDSNISGGGQATLSYTTTSTDNNLKFAWQWSAAIYTFWPGNNQAQILAYHHSDHAGTPENRQVQQSLIQGPRGGGGSNFTGSWSGTGHGACPGAQ
jgi:hypothetical protein